MRILILNTDYPEFLTWMYSHSPGLEHRPYEEQLRVRTETLFGVADFYSSNLRRLGHDATEIHANNEPLQRAWAVEHGVPLTLRRKPQFRLRRHLVPWISCEPRSWVFEILTAQIKELRPDVVLNQAMDSIPVHFLREIKPYLRLLVGQIAAALPKERDFSIYDLVISSLPNFVSYFRQIGIRSELNRLGFQPSVLDALGRTPQQTGVSFVGSFTPAFPSRIHLLEYLCQHVDMEVWGSGLSFLEQESPIRECHKGSAWGRDMYGILQGSKITLNEHPASYQKFANNMRLFEATGVGTLLVTDWKDNLAEIFEPGVDLVAYRTPEECASLIKYYLVHEEERRAIARSGQKRTLGEHTYYHRMQELVASIRPLLP